jgi:hypothetical protein
MREELVVVFHEGHVTSLVRSDAHSSSTYGGPLEHKTSGQSLPRSVHHIAHLGVAQLPFLGAPRYLLDLPLVYGLYYEASTIKYTYGHGSISIESLLPDRPLDGWPYEGYPNMLPYVPLEVGEVSEASWSIFLSRAPNLPEEQPSEVVILVPPPATLGFSMWGKAGDAEGVTLVFECSLESKRVVAYNVCG